MPHWQQPAVSHSGMLTRFSTMQATAYDDSLDAAQSSQDVATAEAKAKFARHDAQQYDEW
jgi:hypothetical protein